jgi:6-pyruvoyltetrahydropterin/6-carboxytetrahydropterin synthase
MTSIFLEDSFDAAHRLPHVPPDHKCARLHGHTYRIRIEVTGPVGEQTGWIMDYAKLRTVWREVKYYLDHRDLNVHFANPTCEIIAIWIAEKLKELKIAGLSRIELRETEHCGVVYVP